MDWKKYVEIDKRYLRPTEVDLLTGDARKAERLLEWEPKVRFKELVRIMVEADLKAERLKLTGTLSQVKDHGVLGK
jgi:GDPmannose 4,6-dehydratase